MVKPTDSEDNSPLGKWRRQKDKVLEVAPVESEDPAEEPTQEPTGEAMSGPKKPALTTPRPSTMGGGPGDLTYLPIQAPPSKGDPTMVPIRARPKGEATMMAGESRAPSGEATMMAGESRAPSGEATMMPVQSPPPKGEATMMAGQARPQGEATMMPGQARPQGEATMMPGQARPQGEATMMEVPSSSVEPTQDNPVIPEDAVNHFIGELKSAASMLGIDFSILQPDAMKVDFFTDTKALRVTFTGREHSIDRIVVRELPPPANIQEQKAVSARGGMLEGDRGGNDAGERYARIDVATIRDVNTGALDWKQINAPEEIKAGRTAMKAHFFNADDGHIWLMELVNSAPPPAGETAPRGPEPELTPEGAKRLVMLLLNCLRTITRDKLSL